MGGWRTASKGDEAIDAAEGLWKVHDIIRFATFDTEPLAIEVRVISPFGRRYLELMTKVDQLMPMLETLAIDEVIEVARFDLQKGLAKKSVRQVAGAARNFLAGLRKRMNAIAEEDAAQADSGKDQTSEAGAGSPNLLAGVPTEDSQAATTKPPRTKQKGKVLTSADSASPLSAPA